MGRLTNDKYFKCFKSVKILISVILLLFTNCKCSRLVNTFNLEISFIFVLIIDIFFKFLLFSNDFKLLILTYSNDIFSKLFKLSSTSIFSKVVFEKDTLFKLINLLKLSFLFINTLFNVNNFSLTRLSNLLISSVIGLSEVKL